jgi:hypothetical protein
VKRGEFVILVGSATAWPFARAQPPRCPENCSTQRSSPRRKFMALGVEHDYTTPGAGSDKRDTSRGYDSRFLYYSVSTKPVGLAR